jgi:hypothetical protein
MKIRRGLSIFSRLFDYAVREKAIYKGGDHEHTDEFRIHAVIPRHGLAQGPFTARDPTGREPDESLVRPLDL